MKILNEDFAYPTSHLGTSNFLILLLKAVDVSAFFRPTGNEVHAFFPLYLMVPLT